MNPIVLAYSDVGANQLGGDLPFFVGKQYGSGWLRTLARVAFPILRRVVGAAGNAAQDVIYNNKPVGEAIKDSAMGEISNFMGTRKGDGMFSDTSHSTSINTSRRKRKIVKRKQKLFPLFAKKSKR